MKSTRDRKSVLTTESWEPQLKAATAAVGLAEQVATKTAGQPNEHGVRPGDRARLRCYWGEKQYTVDRIWFCGRISATRMYSAQFT